MEQHHPIMNKIGDLGDRTYRQTDRHHGTTSRRYPRPVSGHPKSYRSRKSLSLQQGKHWVTLEWQLWPNQVQVKNVYQELDDAVSIFWFKVPSQIVTAIYLNQSLTEFNSVITSYPSITKTIMESHCETLWKKTGEVLWRHPIEYYRAAPGDSSKQAIMDQQRLRSRILILWIKNSLNTDAICK